MEYWLRSFTIGLSAASPYSRRASAATDHDHSLLNGSAQVAPSPMLSSPPFGVVAAVARVGRLAIADAVPGAHVVAVAEVAGQPQRQRARRPFVDRGAGAQVEQRVGAAHVAVVALLERVRHRGRQRHRTHLGLNVHAHLRAALDVPHPAQFVRTFEPLLVVLARGAGREIEAEGAAQRLGLPSQAVRRIQEETARAADAQPEDRQRRTFVAAAVARRVAHAQGAVELPLVGGLFGAGGHLDAARAGAA